MQQFRIQIRFLHRGAVLRRMAEPVPLDQVLCDMCGHQVGEPCARYRQGDWYDPAAQSLCLQAQRWTRGTRSRRDGTGRTWRCPSCTQQHCQEPNAQTKCQNHLDCWADHQKLWGANPTSAPAMSGSDSTIVRRSAGQPLAAAYEARNNVFYPHANLTKASAHHMAHHPTASAVPGAHLGGR